MCGRFTALFSPAELAEVYGVDGVEALALRPSRYNVCPTQEVLAVREDSSGRRLVSPLRWGLVPHWAKDLSLGAKMINARSETVHEKPAFRAIKTRRCIIPGSGWYEWAAAPGRKIPYYFTRRDQAPCSFAGLWESWKSPEGEVVETCSILTTGANEILASIHDRMPVLLAPGDFGLWLDQGITNPANLQHLYRPFPADQLQKWEVSPLVNSTRNNTPECIEPVRKQGTLL